MHGSVGNKAAKRSRCPIGFTFVELLVAIGIIVVLAGFVLPVVTATRAKARQVTCVSNLRQIGSAIALYAQDYDDLYPYGGDPIDIHTNDWTNSSNDADDNYFPFQEARTLPLLVDVLEPYVKSNNLWRCPADVGFDRVDATDTLLDARPTYYTEFGMSYSYRTDLALLRITTTSLVGYDEFPPYEQHGASEVNVLADEHGAWHGGKEYEQKRYCVLMGDGHVKYMASGPYLDAWALALVRPERKTKR